MKAIKKLLLGFFACLAAVAVVACKNESEGPTAADAASTLQITQNHKEIIDDFTVLSVLPYDGVDFAVTWSTDKTDVATVSSTATDGKYTISITRPTDADVKVVLTATVANGEDKATKTFDFTVKMELAPTFENFYNAETGDPISFEGVIVGKQEYSASYGNTSLSVRALDGKGAIYVYRIKCTEEEYNSFVRGAVVTVSGTKDAYNGSLQVGQNTGKITLTGETQAVEPIDISQEVKDGKWVNPTYSTMEEYIALHVGDLVRLENIEVLDKKTTTDSSDITYTLGYGENQTIKMQLKYSSFNDQHDIYKLWSSLTVGEKISGNFVVNYRSGDADAPGARLYVCELQTDLERAESLESLVAEVESYLSAELAKLLPTYVDSENLITEITLPTYDDSRVVVEWQPRNKASGKVIKVVDNQTLTMADSYELPTALTQIDLRANIKVDDPDLGSNVNQNGQGKFLDTPFYAKQTMSTWDKYYVAKDDQELTISGTVYAVGFSENKDDDLGRGMALVQSSEGAYYVMAYDVAEADWNAKFALNHEVTVKGKKDTYNGKYEVIVEGSSLATDVTTGAETTAVTPTDITDLVKDGKTNELDKMQGMYVQIVGGVYNAGSLTVGKKTIAVYADKYFYSYDSLVSNGIYTLSGYLNCYNNLQISPVKASDINKTGDYVVEWDAEMYGTASTNTNMNDEAANHAELVNLDPEAFDVKALKNSASTAIASNPDGTIRLYANTSGDGCSLTVTTKDGKKIAKIEVTFVSNGSKKASISVTGLDGNKDCSSTSEATTFVVEYATAVDSFTIKNVGTEGAQARLTSVKIYYAE